MCLPSDTPTMKYLKIFTVITISIEYNTFNSNPTCIRLYSATLTGWRSTCHLMPRLWISLDLKTSLSQMVEQVRVRGHSISSCSCYSARDGFCWILKKHWVGSHELSGFDYILTLLLSSFQLLPGDSHCYIHLRQMTL